MPKVSVVMAVYNGERYLAEAIENILAQTFADFEFIIVDDGSTDGTFEQLRRYADPRIICLRQSNMGQTRALNRGLAAARGEYIARIDADDVASPERFQRQVEFLDAHPRVGLIGTAVIATDEPEDLKVPLPCLTSNDAIQTALITSHNPFWHGSVMFRRACLDRVGMYRSEFRYAQDYDLWLRIAEAYEVRNLPEPLLIWRLTQDSVTITRRDMQLAFDDLARDCARRRRAGQPEDLEARAVRILEDMADVGDDVSPAHRQALYHFEWGRLLRRAGWHQEARRRFSRSLRLWPWRPTVWLHWSASLLPSRVMSCAILAKRALHGSRR